MKLDFVIFGGVGDLSLRKLLPSLYYLFRDGKLPTDSCIFCVSRGDMTKDHFLALVKDKLEGFLGQDFDKKTFYDFFQILSYLQIDISDEGDWPKLSQVLALKEHEDRNVIYYMSVPPTLFETVCMQLEEHKLNPAYSKVVVEKPLGEDYQSALLINQLLGQSFNENQIYRIDHYLGKKAIQDIVKMRFENKQLNEIWNKDHIEKIIITVSETVGVEGRIEFIDRAGILRDMAQNHLMQILSLIMMDVPDTLSADKVRDAKVAVVKSLRKMKAESVQLNTIKAQYGAGVINGITVPSYQDEIKGHAEGIGETFVAIKTFVDNERWQQMPVILKTGKRLSNRFASVEIIFNHKENKKIHIEIQPTVIFRNMTEIDDLIDEKALNKTGEGRVPEAYEFLIHQVIKGEQANFVRDDEIMASWQFIDSIRAAWQAKNQKIVEYQAGSVGPELKDV